jgi:hypothetical protein
MEGPQLLAGARVVSVHVALLAPARREVRADVPRGGVPRDRLEVLIRAELPAWLPYTIVVTDEPVGDAVIEEEGVA